MCVARRRRNDDAPLAFFNPLEHGRPGFFIEHIASNLMTNDIHRLELQLNLVPHAERLEVTANVGLTLDAGKHVQNTEALVCHP